MPVRIDGQLFDIPPAERHFFRFTSEQRADMRSSHRLGYRQRDRIGDVRWSHPFRPGVCFPTRIAALRAAIATLSTPDAGDKQP